MKHFGTSLIIGLLVLGAADGARAQTIVREGQGDVFHDDAIDDVLAVGDYIVVTGDTTIPAGGIVAGDLLVLGGTLYLEGTVQGDLIGVDADLFLRPGSRVVGDLRNIGGGLYRSELAETGDRVLDDPTMPYRVRVHDGGVTIVSRENRSALALDGPFGFHVPNYNRVDGFAPDWGGTYTFRPLVAGISPGVRGRIGYRTERGEIAGGGSAFLERGGTALEGGWYRDTHSQDRWIRSDLRNSADFLIDGGDMRYYYEADVAFGELRHRFGDLEADKTMTLGLRFQQEDARSLRAGNPWTAFGPDTLLVNAAIDVGTIQSFIPFVDAEWLTARTATDVRVEVEQGSYDALVPAACGVAPCPGGASVIPGDGSFTRLRIDSEFAMQALLDHTIEIELQFMLPVAGDEPLPRQRWGLLGGSGSLRTRQDAEFYGDNLAYSETEYTIPLRFATLPRVDIVPNFQLLHMAGHAWSGDADPDFVQNIGARLNVWAFFARYLMDPETSDSELTFGVSWPFGSGYDWEE